MTNDAQPKTPSSFSNIINPQTDEDFLNIYKMRDVKDYIHIILQRYANLSLYVIEPYREPRTGEALTIPINDNFELYDYGNRLVVAAKDIYQQNLFSTSMFFSAVHQALDLLIQVGVQEVAILGDPRAKNFFYDWCERKKINEPNVPTLVNFTPPETFKLTYKAVVRYLAQQGLELTHRLPLTAPKFTS